MPMRERVCTIWSRLSVSYQWLRYLLLPSAMTKHGDEHRRGRAPHRRWIPGDPIPTLNSRIAQNVQGIKADWKGQLIPWIAARVAVTTRNSSSAEIATPTSNSVIITIPIPQSTLRAPPPAPRCGLPHLIFGLRRRERWYPPKARSFSPFSSPLRQLCYLWTRVPRVRVSWAPFKCRGWVGGRGDRGVEPTITGELCRVIRVGCCARPGWQVGSPRQRDACLV